MTTTNLLVVCGPESPELSVLKDRLPDRVRIVAIAQHAQDFDHLSEEEWASVDVLLACGILPNQAKRADLVVRAHAACMRARWLTKARAHEPACLTCRLQQLSSRVCAGTVARVAQPEMDAHHLCRARPPVVSRTRRGACGAHQRKSEKGVNCAALGATAGHAGLTWLRGASKLPPMVAGP